MNELAVPTSEEIEVPSLNIHDVVEERLREAQANKTFKDSDIRIGGSRKEQSALRKILRFGLGDLNQAEKDYGEVATISFVKKDKVFPVFSAKEQLDRGVTSGAAFLKMKMREAYPTKPSVINAASRRLYVGYANMLFDEFLPVPTVELFVKKQDELWSRLSYDIIKFVLDTDWENEMASIMGFYGNDSIVNAYVAGLERQDQKDYAGKFVPFRKEFVDLEDAYNYQKDYFPVLKHAYSAAGNWAQTELGKLGISYWSLHITDRSGNFVPKEDALKGIRDKLGSSPFRQTDVVVEEDVERIYTIERMYLDYSKMSAFDDSPLLASAMNKIELTKDGNAWRFYKNFFSARFNNFMRRLDQKGEAVYESSYVPAVETYQGISESKSVEDIKNFKERWASELDKYREEYKLATDAKFVEEMDALVKESKVTQWGFYMNWYKPNGKYVLDHARYELLTRKDDKYNWWAKLIGQLEKEVNRIEKYISDYVEKHQPRPDNWSWAAEELGADVETTVETAEGEKIVSKGRKKTLHDKKILEFIERTGGLLIDKSKLTDVEAIKAYLRDTFGFKAFEYGASLPDVEAKEIIYHFLGAMSDFGEILNIDIAGLNRRCGLSMGFGSRGRGRAKASYFPLARIINLTRSNGDGSVAHELGHYLDNMISFLDNPGRYVYLDFATEGQIPVEYTDRSLRKKTQGKHELDSIEVKQAIWQIMSYIMYGYKMSVTNGSVSYRPEPGVLGYVEYVATAENAGNAQFTSGFSIPKMEDLSVLPKYLAGRAGMGSYRFENLSKSQLKVYDVVVRDAGLKEFTFRIPSKMSRYYSESKQVGGAYWIEKPELFARAFEVYVYDKLKKADRYNNFLVEGDYQDDSIDFLAEYPYPQHEEREYLFVLFDNLILAMKQAYDIGDFIPFTEERNKHTRVTLDISELPQQKAERLLEKKLKELLVLMATEQMKSGGSLTPNKAKRILREGTAHGYPLTDKQKRFFGWIAGGGKKAEGGPPLGAPSGEERINWAELLSGVMETRGAKKIIAGQECDLQEEGADSLILSFIDESALMITVTKQPNGQFSIKLNVGVPEDEGNGENIWIANDIFDLIKARFEKLGATVKIVEKKAYGGGIDFSHTDLFQEAVNKLKEGNVLDVLFWKIYNAFVHHQLDGQLEDWLHEYYENPGYEEHIEKITANLEKEADNISHEYKVNYMLDSLGLSILATYEKIDASTDEKEIDRLHEDILLLQAAINFIIANRDTLIDENDEDKRYIWQMLNSGGTQEPLIASLKEIFTELLKKTKQTEYLKRLQEHIEAAVPHMQLNWFAVRHIEEGYDDWVKAKERGFEKVQIDRETGWGDYRSNLLWEHKIDAKPMDAKIKMCQWPNGKFSYGVSFNDNTAGNFRGHGYSCGLKNGLYDTERAAILAFYKEMSAGFFDENKSEKAGKTKEALFKNFRDKYGIFK